MKKNILFPLLIIFSGVVFAACNKVTNQTEVDDRPDKSEVESQQSADGDSFVGKVKDLASFNKNQKCTWSDPQSGEGVVYVSGDKTRSEVKILATTSQPAQEMFSISDGEWVYSWNSMTKKGMKTKIDEAKNQAGDEVEVAKPEEDNKSDSAYQEMNNQDYEFKCESWQVDQNKFTPPAEVEFVDMNEVMGQIRQNPQDMSKICDMLSGDDKAECLKGFENGL